MIAIIDDWHLAAADQHCQRVPLDHRIALWAWSDMPRWPQAVSR